MFSPDTARPLQVAFLMLQWPGLLPALMSLALVVILAGLPLLRRDASGDAFARAALLTAGGLAAVIFSAAVLKNDSALLNAPGFALITKNPDYLVTALLPAGALGMILGLPGMSRSQLRNHADASFGNASNACVDLGRDAPVARGQQNGFNASRYILESTGQHLALPGRR